MHSLSCAAIRLCHRCGCELLDTNPPVTNHISHRCKNRVSELGLNDRFEYAGELDRASKIAFLQSLDVMGIPTIYHESKGLSALEALANAVPLVAPRHGTFPELIEQTGAGLLCEPENRDGHGRKTSRIRRQSGAG